MSNQPSSWELLLVPDGMKKVSVEMDTRVPNAATFLVKREDHTLGNMLRCKLLNNPQVIFVGYKQSHPLEHDFVLKIHTTKDITPIQVFQDEINNLITEINGIMRTFQDEITLTTMHGME